MTLNVSRAIVTLCRSKLAGIVSPSVWCLRIASYVIRQFNIPSRRKCASLLKGPGKCEVY